MQGVLHFAEKNQEVKKNGVFIVPFTKLVLLDQFNDREDYGDLDELAESIYNVGPKVPLKGYKAGEKYVVIVGHRRFRAAEMIMDKYKKDILFQVIVYPQGFKKSDMLLDTLLTNSGKDLTPLEKASTVHKLIEEKVSVKDVAGALGGVSEVYVKNLDRLWNIPDMAKKLIRDGVVSATTVMGYLKSKGANLEEWIAEVIKMAGIEDDKPKKGKGKKKKTAKVTAKNAPKTKVKSMGEFKRFREDPTGCTKTDVYNFICGLQDNKLSFDEIKAFLTSK